MADATFADLLGSDILLHYDASDASSLFSDTAGTTLAVDGGEVECIKPQSTALLQVDLTNANGPTYRADYSSSGYSALQFNGVNNALANASTGLTAGTNWFALTAFTPLTGTGAIWSRGANSTHFARLFQNTAPNFLAQSTGATNFSVSLVTSTAKQVLAIANQSGHNEFNGLGFSIGNQTANAVSASIAGNFTLGAANFTGLTAFAAFAFHEVLIIGSSCEWGQVLRAAKIMRNKWGITDPNATPQKSGGTSGFTGLSGVGRLGT